MGHSVRFIRQRLKGEAKEVFRVLVGNVHDLRMGRKMCEFNEMALKFWDFQRLSHLKIFIGIANGMELGGLWIHVRFSFDKKDMLEDLSFFANLNYKPISYIMDS